MFSSSCTMYGILEDDAISGSHGALCELADTRIEIYVGMCCR
jgi:hypothetical protein